MPVSWMRKDKDKIKYNRIEFKIPFDEIQLNARRGTTTTGGKGT
jgi:hypothetical protein